jgi:hypothetical protein
VSDAGIAGQVQTAPCCTSRGFGDNRSRIAWAAVMRAGIAKFAKFVFASGPADHHTYRHLFTDRHLLPGPGFGDRVTGYRSGTRRKSM